MAASAATSKMKKVAAISQKQAVFQAADPVLAVLGWGVAHAAAELAAVPQPPLVLGADFKAFAKTSIHNQGFNDAALPGKFKVKQYCPVVFRDLRMRFGEDPDVFLVRRERERERASERERGASSSQATPPPPCLAVVHVRRAADRGREPRALHRLQHARQPGAGSARSWRAGWGRGVFFSHVDPLGFAQLVIKTLGREEVARFHANFPAYHAVRGSLAVGEPRVARLTRGDTASTSWSATARRCCLNFWGSTASRSTTATRT
jgi:hypothetical protein